MAEAKTVREAIEVVLSQRQQALSLQEIYEEICRQKLYEFKAKDPIGVVRSQLKRNCEGAPVKNTATRAIFTKTDDGRFGMRSQP